jgi:hypothetical protein
LWLAHREAPEQEREQDRDFGRDTRIGHTPPAITDCDEHAEQRAEHDERGDIAREQTHCARERDQCECAYAGDLPIGSLAFTAFALDADQEADAERDAEADDEVGREIHAEKCNRSANPLSANPPEFSSDVAVDTFSTRDACS